MDEKFRVRILEATTKEDILQAVNDKETELDAPVELGVTEESPKTSR